MILSTTQVIQWLIVFGALLFFVIPFLINRKVKVPEGTVLPEKCNSCVVDSCMVKSTSTLKDASVEEIKQKLRDEMNKCDQITEQEVQNEKK